MELTAKLNEQEKRKNERAVWNFKRRLFLIQILQRVRFVATGARVYKGCM